MAPSTGGCLCGAVRYAVAAAFDDVGYCHCRVCQRASGAPVLVFATLPLQAFAITRGQPSTYRSSPTGERWFCAGCGTQLAMRVDEEPHTIDITVASLDEPLSAPPDNHIWVGARIDWFETVDHLPRFEASRPPAATMEASCC